MSRADAYIVCKEICAAVDAQPNTIATDILLAAMEQVRAAEREECAKLAAGHFVYGHSVAGPGFAAKLAAKIRARGK